MRKGMLLWVGVSHVVGATLVLAGCSSGGSEEQARPWAAEFEQVYQGAETDLVRSIASDGELTLAEMREAAAVTNECFERAGHWGSILEVGGGEFTHQIEHWDPEVMFPSEEVRLASLECKLRYFNELWILWDTVRLNPEAADFDELIAECLVRNNVAAVGLTGQQFQEAARACDFTFEADPDNPISDEEWGRLLEEHWETHADCRPQLPGGIYLDEGIAWDCRMDPMTDGQGAG